MPPLVFPIKVELLILTVLVEKFCIPPPDEVVAVLLLMMLLLIFKTLPPPELRIPPALVRGAFRDDRIVERQRSEIIIDRAAGIVSYRADTVAACQFHVVDRSDHASDGFENAARQIAVNCQQIRARAVDRQACRWRRR